MKTTTCTSCRSKKIGKNFNFCPDYGSNLSCRALTGDVDYTNEFTETLLEEIDQIDWEENQNNIKDHLNEIKSGDKVSFYNGYYTYSSDFNEFGDREVIDVQEEKFGKVLVTMDNEALCLFYNFKDNGQAKLDKIFIDELHVQWISIENLYVV